MIKDSPRSAPNSDIQILFVHQVLIRPLILIGNPINRQIPIVTVVIRRYPIFIPFSSIVCPATYVHSTAIGKVVLIRYIILPRMVVSIIN